jgi:uncharacterized protein (DUF2235 family)
VNVLAGQGAIYDYERHEETVVCCDGMWCGYSTGTNTNVKLIANCIAGGPLNSERNERENVVLHYF